MVDWEEGGTVHNWKNYVEQPLRDIWDTFTEAQQEALINTFQYLADKEEWD